MALREGPPLGGRQRDDAHLARLLWVVSGLLVLSTEWLLPSTADHLMMSLFAVAGIVAGLAMPLLPWDRWPAQTLLAVTISGQVTIGLAGVAADGATQRYVALYAVSYLFIGLTQLPMTAFKFVPLTVVTYAVGAGLDSATAWFEFLVLTTVSVVIAETLSRNSTRRRRAEGTVRQLLESNRQLSRSYSVQEATQVLTGAMTRALQTDLVAVLLQDDTDPNRYVEVSENDTVVGFGPMVVNIATEQSGVAVAVRSGEIVFVPDALTSVIPSRRMVEATGLVSGLYVPLMGHHRCLGAIVAGWRHSVDRLDDLDRQAIEVLSAEAGLVVERLQEKARLAWEADSEPLTGLANRRSFTRALTTSSEPDAVVMIDLDGFKAVNDRYGHAIGDEVLLAMAECLRRSSRDGDCVSRFGGDEFAVVLHEGGAPAAQALLDRLATAWRETDPLVAYSTGFAVRREGEDPQRTLERADEALYIAKKQPDVVFVAD
jgi:diguanylate cyclase (GGDEF)-like protein